MGYRHRGAGVVIFLFWAGWAVAVLVAPVLRRLEGDGLGIDSGSVLVQRSSRGPRRIERSHGGTSKQRMANIVQDLASMYSEECACADTSCPSCAEEAKKRVSAALDNAIAREFLPPSDYYRSKSGYAYRFRGYKQPKRTHEFLDLEPMRTSWRERRAAAPAAPPKALQQGLRPIPVQGHFVTDTGARSYVKAHLVSRKVRRSAQLRQQQTTKLWQFDYVPLADEEFPNKHPTQLEKEEHLRELAAACKEDPSVDACKELPQEQEDKEVEDDIADSPWFEDWLTHAKLILEDGTLEEAKAASSIPPENNAAFAIPYQEGQEADWADWVYAHDDDAVVPLRLVEGESNFPEMDANINAPGAVLEDYPGQSGGGESYASFLKHPAGEGEMGQEPEMQPDSSSVNGWLTDVSGY